MDFVISFLFLFVFNIYILFLSFDPLTHLFALPLPLAITILLSAATSTCPTLPHSPTQHSAPECGVYILSLHNI